MKAFVGQNVQLYRSDSSNQSQPEAALITFVHSDVLVNVAAWDANGYPLRGISSIYYRASSEAPLPGNATTYVQPIQESSSDSKEG